MYTPHLIESARTAGGRILGQVRERWQVARSLPKGLREDPLKTRRKRVTTEISVETTETILIHRSRQGGSLWCGQCGMETETLSVEEATMTMNLDPQVMYRWIEEGRVHSCQPQMGNLRVCLRSLSLLLPDGV